MIERPFDEFGFRDIVDAFGAEILSASPWLPQRVNFVIPVTPLTWKSFEPIQILSLALETHVTASIACYRRRKFNWHILDPMLVWRCARSSEPMKLSEPCLEAVSSGHRDLSGCHP